MSGLGNPFKEIPKEIWKSIKRTITRKGRCNFCNEKKRLKYLEVDYLDRYVCVDKKPCKERSIKRYQELDKHLNRDELVKKDNLLGFDMSCQICNIDREGDTIYYRHPKHGWVCMYCDEFNDNDNGIKRL